MYKWKETTSGENQMSATVLRQSSDPTLGISLSYPAALPSKFLRCTCARPRGRNHSLRPISFPAWKRKIALTCNREKEFFFVNLRFRIKLQNFIHRIRYIWITFLISILQNIFSKIKLGRCHCNWESIKKRHEKNIKCFNGKQQRLIIKLFGWMNLVTIEASESFNHHQLHVKLSVGRSQDK